MTPEQVDLEFAHIAIDKKIKDKLNGSNAYEDEEYDNYDKETDAKDARLSDNIEVTSEVTLDTDNKGKWEDVGIDELS